MIQPSWQLSASISLVLTVVWVGCAVSGAPALRVVKAFALEFAVLVGVFAVYQHTAYLAHGQTAGAFANARDVWDLERWLHLPSEVTVQQLTAGWAGVERGLNWYYAYMHLNVMTAFVVWMWWRHRERYALLRNTVAITTLVCVLMQMVPVAPPRMFPELGFVDTAKVYGQSVYTNGGIADQLGAMPSIHVAWAGIVGIFGAWAVGRRWGWAFLLHFAMVAYVVVATANHWWLDGVVGLAVMGVVMAVLFPIHAGLARRAAARSAEPAELPDELSDAERSPALS
jgi:hypothetical protein